PVGAAVVHGIPRAHPALFQVRVASTHAVSFQHDVVVGTPPDTQWRALQNEPLSQQCLFRRVDHDQAVSAGTFFWRGGLDHLGDACLFVAVVQASPTPWSFVRVLASLGLCQMSISLNTLHLLSRSVKRLPGETMSNLKGL